MPPVSYILTYRESGDPARRDNLHAVLAWLARHPGFEPVVVEQDELPRLTGPLPHPGARLVFAYNPGPFNKSWGLNLGARVAPHPLLAFADADVIVGDVLPEMAAALARGHALVKPYRRLVDLDEAEAARVRGGDFDWWPDDPARRNRQGIGEHLVLAGGLFALTRQAFVEVGGWDERFLGWGGEDDAMSFMLERARIPGIELDRRPAVHLPHRREPASTTGQPHYDANRALLASYREADAAGLDRLAEIQVQLMGHRDRHRPQ